MFTMSPEPCSSIPSIAAWVVYRTPMTLVCSIRRQSSGSAPTIVPSSITPALFTRTSSPPSSSRVRRTAPAQAASSVTSRSRVSTVAPSARSFPASASRRSLRRAPRATAAPARARATAVASPMPDDAPVTSATLPASGRVASVIRPPPRPHRATRGRLSPIRREPSRAGSAERDAEATHRQPQQHRPRAQQVPDPCRGGLLQLGHPAPVRAGSEPPCPVERRGVGPHLPPGLPQEHQAGRAVDRREQPVEAGAPAAGPVQLDVLGGHPRREDPVDPLVVSPPAVEHLGVV